MITKTRTKNSDLKQLLFVEKMPNNTISNKKLLFKMAKNLKPRPKKEMKIGRALNMYISKHSTSYDEIFTKKIKELAPHWFKETKIIVIKKELIELAKSGDKKPNKQTRIGNWLAIFINKSHGYYDSKFVKIIKKLRPDWFVNKSKMQHTKEEKRGGQFLSKFRILTFLIGRDQKEIYSKQKLSKLYFNSTHTRHIKATERLAKFFQREGLLVLCDEKGNPRIKQDSTKKSHWKLQDDILSRLGFANNDYKN